MATVIPFPVLVLLLGAFLRALFLEVVVNEFRIKVTLMTLRGPPRDFFQSSRSMSHLKTSSSAIRYIHSRPSFSSRVPVRAAVRAILAEDPTRCRPTSVRISAVG